MKTKGGVKSGIIQKLFSMAGDVHQNFLILIQKITKKFQRICILLHNPY